MKRLALIALCGLAACAGILGFKDGKTRKPFEHRAHVLKGIACVKCHKGIATAGETGPLHLPDNDSCLECHEKPHDTRPCLGCHSQEFTASDLIQARKYLRFTHVKHSELVSAGQCVKCHAAVKYGDGRLRPTMGTCLGCHEHKDDFKVRDCEKCHVDLPEETTQPASHLVHDGDFLREHGARASSSGELCATCHKPSFCTSCHGASVPSLPSRYAFDDPLRLGMHRAGFRARHSEEALAEPGLCATCHTQESCAGCHDSNGVGVGSSTPRSPHPAGWVGVGTPNEHGRAAQRDPANCAACHSGAGEMLCVSCHQVGGIGGSPHPTGWSSSRSLTELPCRLCHTSGI